MRKAFFLLLFFAPLSLLVSGQEKRDAIWLMSGKVMENVTVTTVGDTEIKYVEHKKSKNTERFLDKYRVFSIKRADGSEELVYHQDTLIGNYFTEEEMRLFVIGEKDAMDKYHAPGYTLAGMATCFAPSFLLYDNFLMIGTPFITTGASGLPGMKIKPKNVSDPKYLAEPAYIQGYERTARSKRVQNALIGSAIGLVAGLTLGNIFEPVIK